MKTELQPDASLTIASRQQQAWARRQYRDRVCAAAGDHADGVRINAADPWMHSPAAGNRRLHLHVALDLDHICLHFLFDLSVF